MRSATALACMLLGCATRHAPPPVPFVAESPPLLQLPDGVRPLQYALDLEVVPERPEFRGSADVNNPAVPDMVSVGPSDGGTPFGHGLTFYNTSPVVAIAEATDMATLPRVTAAVGGEWVRIPRDAILDLVSWTSSEAATAPSCGPPVHDSLDGQQARLIGNWSVDLRSITRRSVSSTADGRPVLLRTRSSANDFVAAQPSPGRVP